MTRPRLSAKDVPAVSARSYCSPSSRSVWPQRPEISTPSNSFFSLRLTTPLIASDPYTADAPPVMISTVSIRAGGMTLRSGTPSPLPGINRIPSTRTSVRAVPRPRRSTFASPPLTEPSVMLDVLVADGTNCGSAFSVVSTVTDPVRSNAAWGTDTNGLADSKSRRGMREPVTTISSSTWSSALAGSWQAIPARTQNADSAIRADSTSNPQGWPLDPSLEMGQCDTDSPACRCRIEGRCADLRDRGRPRGFRATRGQ